MSSPETIHSMVSAVSNLNTHTSFTVASTTSSNTDSLTPPTSPASHTFVVEKIEMHHPMPQKLHTVEVAESPVNGVHLFSSDEATAHGISHSRKTSSLVESLAVDDIDEYKEIAMKLYQEDFVSIQPEEYTQFLAANDDESAEIRSYYMDLFRWDENLLMATRRLCSKLYLRGESQEIDRILSSFTKSYLKQHPSNIFCTRNFEQIYIIIYSLILLNTALHNSELNKKSKISQADFIKNTFSTFMQQSPSTSRKLTIKQRITIEQELSTFYDDLSRTELHLKQAAPEDASPRLHQPAVAKYRRGEHPLPHEFDNDPTFGHENQFSVLSRQATNSSIWSTDTTTNRRTSLAMKRMTTTSSNASQFTSSQMSREQGKNARVGMARALMSDQNKFYKNGNHSQFSQVTRNTTMTLRNRQSKDHMHSSNASNYGSLNKKSSRSSVVSRDSTTNSIFGDEVSVLSIDTQNLNQIDFDGLHDDAVSQQELENFNVEDYQDQYDLTLELQGSPYLKEGLLKLKIFNNDQQDGSQEMTAPVSSAASTISNSSGRGFFSFFSRSHTNNPSAARNQTSTVGTSSHVLSANKFVENFVVVSKGELSLYSFDPKVIKKHQQKVRKLKNKRSMQLMTITEFDNLEEENQEDEVGDGNWLKNAAKIGSYNLCSCFAQLEKSSTSSTKKVYTWSLSFPKISKKPAKKFLFESGTKEIALEFVNTCNFWASKITAIPTLEESVSSIEYGWTNLDGIVNRREQFKKNKNIMKWEPVVKGVYLSNYIVVNDFDESANHLGMMKQFVKTLKYYDHLKKLLNEFNQMKLKFMKSLPMKQYACTNYSRVIHNYDAKLEEYKSELNKYKNYLIILGFGLQLRFDLETQDRLDATLDEEDVVYDDQHYPAGRDDDDLTRLVKFEIKKLFFNMKDIGKIIPTFQSSKSIHNLTTLTNQEFFEELEDGRPFPLVKSPKTFTLSNFNDNESPIAQLINSSSTLAKDDKDLPHSYSTGTIKEEDEPEDQELETKVDTPNLSTESFSSATLIKEPMLAIRNTEMPMAVIIT
ncbi:hypothetical protein G9P44_004603 [Scheffersomyces stipitis]|nr:hypothetical protein G9P44_004603 [Scheffersomyces stipitis]